MANPEPLGVKITGDSFETLFLRYAKGLLVFAQEFSIRKEDAEDIVHDIFVNLWEKRDSIQSKTVGAYLFRATHNQCINFLSHLKVRSKYQQDIISEVISPVRKNIDFYIQSELRRILEEAVTQLPPQRREVFIKSRLDGKKAEDIALEMNISRRTVDKHIQLSSKEVKKYISQYLYSILLLGLI